MKACRTEKQEVEIALRTEPPPKVLWHRSVLSCTGTLQPFSRCEPERVAAVVHGLVRHLGGRLRALGKNGLEHRVVAAHLGVPLLM